MAKNPDPLYLDYLAIKKQAWEEDRVRLTEKDFLDTIDPSRRHGQTESKRYMDKLRSGEWSSERVNQRSMQGGGRLYNVLLADKSGRVIDSANVQLVAGQSIVDQWKSGKLDRAADKYMSGRHTMTTAERKNQGIASVGRRSKKGLKIVGIRPLRTTRKKVVYIG